MRCVPAPPCRDLCAIVVIAKLNLVLAGVLDVCVLGSQACPPSERLNQNGGSSGLSPLQVLGRRRATFERYIQWHRGPT